MSKNIGLIIHPEDFKDLLDMSHEETGIIIQNVIRHFQGENNPVDFSCFSDPRFLSRILREMCSRVDRDKTTYENKSKAGSIGGKRGGAPLGNQNASKNKAETKQKQSRNKAKQTPIPKPIPIPKPNINSYVEEIVRFLNERTGKHFQPKGETERLINGRINEGYTVDDFKKVITIKCNEWKDDPKYSRYLQPSTLFAPSHFDEYLNQPEKATKPSLVKPNQFTEMEKRNDYDMDALMQKLVKN